MIRSAISITAAVLVLLPVVGYAQQEAHETTEAARTAAAARTRGAPLVQQHPSPEVLTVREGMAIALDGVVASPKAIPAPPAGTWGIVSEGTGGGGVFRDTDSDAEAWLASSSNGVTGYGSLSGGFFSNSTSSGLARLGWGDWGLAAGGDYTGAYIADADGSGFAWIGYDRPSGTDKGGTANAGEYGVYAGGSKAGGYFEDTDGTGYAYVGSGSYGIMAYGSSYGGYFKDSDSTGWARLGYGNSGVQGFGAFTGGYFYDSDGSGFAYAAYDRASGVDKGGDPNAGEYGVYAGGSEAGGYFEETDGTGYAYLGNYDAGIYGFGSEFGGVFWDSDGTGHAWVASGDIGIYSFGEFAGAYCQDSDSSGYADVGTGSYKISGSGSVSFVQNHPHDRSLVIVYAAPEGDEVATYTRGTARLIDGEATVPLGETFKWVTNPDIGLTAHVTPRAGCNGLYVAEVSTEEMVVRELQDGTSDCNFDYLVYGLRIGFEETSVVQEKSREAYIPSMSDHRELYERRPDLRRYNSLERFKEMRHAVGKGDALDLTRAHALRDAIVEFDPAVHELPRPTGFDQTAARGFTARNEGDSSEAQTRDDVAVPGPPRERRFAPDHPAISSRIPVDDGGNVYATSFRPSAREVASLVEVSETVEAGDVLVIDRDDPGMMRRGFEAHDTGVIGVVAADAGVVLGADSSMSEGSVDDVPQRAAVALAGVAGCKVDAAYGAIWPGDLLVTSPTPGHAMRSDTPLPGTMLGKALEPLAEGTGMIRVLVMLR